MTLAELKAFIESERKCSVFWVEPGSRVGPDQVGFIVHLPLSRFSTGGYRVVDVILLDQERPVHELIGVYFHELGHKVYHDTVARINWSHEDSEFFAYRYGLRELIQRGLSDCLKEQVENIEQWLSRNRSESTAHEAAILRLLKTDEWREAKQSLAQDHDGRKAQDH